MMEKETNALSVGEKLLKEPIWIGMIVILNLILFFCITYVIRRKCGQRISELIPSRKKSDSTGPKDQRTDPPSFERSTYSLSIETTPRLSVVTRPKPRMSIEINQQDKPEPSISSSISLPQTPVITEHNSEAALKLFAAYKADKEVQPTLTELTVDNDKILPSQNRRDFITCGFQGGRVSFSDEDEHSNDRKDKSKENGLVRSKSSEIDAFGSDDRKFKRVFTYPKPCNSGPKIDIKRDINRNSEHCYPEIRIVNEFDEEFKNIDSDDSEMDSQRLKHGVSSSKSLCNDDLNLATNLEAMDSGYPSTSTVSSNNTQPPNQETFVTKHSNPTAAERRRMFGAKSKSSTFYRLSAQTLEAENDEIELPTVSINESLFDKRPTRVIPNRPEFRSFETGMVCRSCNDLTNFSVNSFSIESDIEQMRRCESFCQCCSGHEYQPPRHICGRRKHQRRHKCCCHRHSYPERDHSRHVHTRPHYVHHSHQSRYFTRYTSPTSRYLSLSEIRDIRRNHKRALARLSSTESEGLNQEVESYHKRRLYSSKEHYSDGCMSYGVPRKRLSSSPNFTSSRDDCFKNQMMQSFLSDTYNSNAQLNKQSMDIHPEVAGSSNRLGLPQYSITEQPTNTALNNSQCSSQSISPKRGQSYKSQSPNSIKSNPSPAEYSIIEETPSHSAAPEVIKNQVRVCDSNSGIMKDSAYQTKQSSIEMHNTIQREGSLLACNTRKDDCLGPDKRTDPVRRHLQKAALKLVLLKRKQNLQDSKDSAIQTFSGDDMSFEEDNRRSFENRKGALLSMQMKEIKLSQVQEEHSILSKDTDSYNTPNNETTSETTEKNVASFDKTISSANIFINDDLYSVQETVV